jgi:hypothetical protein
MSDIARKTVTRNIACPLEFCRVCVAGSNIAGLKLFELLLSAEFVGL